MNLPRGDVRLLGADLARAGIDRPGLRMARISLRPTWVGLVDFRSRMPKVLSGSAA
jgi:hypothetical protein